MTSKHCVKIRRFLPDAGMHQRSPLPQSPTEPTQRPSTARLLENRFTLKIELDDLKNWLKQLQLQLGMTCPQIPILALPWWEHLNTHHTGIHACVSADGVSYHTLWHKKITTSVLTCHTVSYYCLPIFSCISLVYWHIDREISRRITAFRK